MGTILVYNSTASTFVKPDIVELSIRIKSSAVTASDAVAEINENRQLAKNFICNKKSYTPDSYHQYSLNLSKRTHREYYYDNGSNKITEEQYNDLSVVDKALYDKRYIDKFIGYDANLTITATLSFGETVVADLVDIFNMATEKNMNCTYDHTISKDLHETTMQELYTMCINYGIANVHNIVLGINSDTTVFNKNLSLLSIMDPSATSMRDRSEMMFACEKRASIGNSYEPEQIVMPELIEELFNNNIELTKSLDLKFEFT